MPRIAFCITTLDQGGAERQLAELVTRLPRDVFEPHVVVLAPRPQPPADTLARLLDRHMIPVTFLGARRAWDAPRTWQALVRTLRQWQPAVLQTFLAHANVLGALAGRRAGVPHIVTGIRVAEQRQNWHLWGQRRAARYVERHVCVSRSVAEFAEHTMGLDAAKLVVIPNGVDSAHFAAAPPINREKFGLRADQPFLLFAGRLDPQKRPDWLLEQMPAILQQLPQHAMVIAGDGPMRDSLLQRAKTLGLGNRVHFVGFQSDLANWYAAANLVVLTSAWEGMPNVILEAMAAGRPVVATETHGLVELLDDNDSGQITPANDPDAFIEAVVRIAQNPPEASRLGEQNHRRAVEHFSIDRAVTDYANLYLTLTANSPNSIPDFR